MFPMLPTESFWSRLLSSPVGITLNPVTDAPKLVPAVIDPRWARTFCVYRCRAFRFYTRGVPAYSTISIYRSFVPLLLNVPTLDTTRIFHTVPPWLREKQRARPLYHPLNVMSRARGQRIESSGGTAIRRPWNPLEQREPRNSRSILAECVVYRSRIVRPIED